jgi:glycosyltransferase involved in cell wall biosynthesis
LRFSVVIPCHNGAEHLGAALDSVSVQTRPAHEVLVVDDASTDDSVGLARRRRATVLSMGRNAGAAAARNVGIGRASGDAIAFLDADDVWHPTHLESLAHVFHAAPGAGVAFTGAEDTHGRTIAATRRWPEATALDLRWHLLGENPLAQSGAAVRAPLLRAVGGYAPDVRHAEDYDLWLRLSRRTLFACCHAPTVTYRRHAGQASRDSAAMWRGLWSARARALQAIERECQAPDVARARALLLHAWDSDLQSAWHDCATVALDTLLDLHALVPQSAALYETWERRRRRWWNARLAGRALARRLPSSVRQRLRALESRAPG